MLDELLEYKEYTDKKILDDLLKENSGKKSTKDLKQNRLKYLNFSNGYSGISRAMKIIAKYFLNKYDQNTDIAINALKAWAGDKYDNLGIKEIDEIAGYVPKLFDYYLENEKNTINNKNKINNIKKMIKDYNNQLKSFNEDFINKKSQASKAQMSDFNKITYQNVVYNMRNKKLNRYVLVCKNDVLDTALINNKPLAPKEKDYLLKIIAFYLLNSKKNLDSVSVVLTDIYNWSLCSHKSYRLCDYNFKDGAFPIIIEKNGILAKIKLNDVILNNYSIIEVDRIRTMNNYLKYYVDQGVFSIMN